MIITNNTNTQLVDPGDVIALGMATHYKNCDTRLNGNSIIVNGNGLYRITGYATCESVGAGTASVSIYRDGVLIPGAVSEDTVAAGVDVTLPIHTVIKMKGCCCEDPAIITAVWSGTAGTVFNIVLDVDKV